MVTIKKSVERGAVCPQNECESYTALNEGRTLGAMLPALLLHSCCGPCSTAVITRLAQRFAITVYFANSNIDDEDEYKRRLDAQRKYIDEYNSAQEAAAPVTLVVAPYRPAAFLESFRGLEAEPEGGLRCEVCIAGRMEQAAAYASMHGHGEFTTTLSVSPHKNFELIRKIGGELSVRYSVGFLSEDFKKHAGYSLSVELSKKHGLYRQDYCGCSFSKKAREAGR
jgi:predicted adenine nucleotide alpha hydrolase (AANH) superfamily ATPase